MTVKDFRIIKPEIRVLGVDDGRFIPHTHGNVIVVGVIFRGGCSIDGVMHTHIDIDGFNATYQIAHMISDSPHSKQLRVIMLNGITFAGFNVVDINELTRITGIPVIALTENKPDLASIESALKNLSFTKERWETVLKAGQIQRVNCKGKSIYMVLSGVSQVDAQEIVRLTSNRSCFPEPLRVAHLIASGITP